MKVVRIQHRAAALAALYNASDSSGFGKLVNRPKMTVDEAKQQFEELESKGTVRLYFDYINGRVIKVDFSSLIIDLVKYDRDNGRGAGFRALEDANVSVQIVERYKPDEGGSSQKPGPTAEDKLIEAIFGTPDMPDIKQRPQPTIGDRFDGYHEDEREHFPEGLQAGELADFGERLAAAMQLEIYELQQFGRDERFHEHVRMRLAQHFSVWIAENMVVNERPSHDGQSVVLETDLTIVPSWVWNEMTRRTQYFAPSVRMQEVEPVFSEIPDDKPIPRST